MTVGGAELHGLPADSTRIGVTRASFDELAAALEDGLDVIVIDDVPDAAADTVASVLAPAVFSGAGLVVTGKAVTALPGSTSWDRLVGREPLPKTTDKDGGAASSGLVVAVLDQRHGVTQSIPHFVHDGVLSRAEPVSRARVIAGAVAFEKKLPALMTPRPIIWSHGVGRGRVVVSALDTRAGRSAELAATIALRAAEWTGDGEVTFPVASHAKGKYRLLAEMLDPTHEGIFRDHGPMPGFYRGREVARFMTYHGASWLTRAEREREESPERVLDSLGIEKGQTVCDLGAGNGYFSLRLAERVGAGGRVLAVDIQKEMLALLEKRAGEKGITNVELILAEESDPKLPAGSVDLVLMVDVYHELSKPAPVMKHVRRALKPRGRVVIVEYRGEDPGVRIKPRHRILERQAIAELEAQGFRWLETKSFLSKQHIMVFGPGRERSR